MARVGISFTSVAGPVLVVVHFGLGVWGIMGLVELLVSEPPWPALSNPLFTPTILLLQWVLVLTAALVFVPGYLIRWSLLPWAMAFVYAAMAALCAVETIGYLESRYRFLAMAAEYVAYLAILAFLFQTVPRGDQTA